MEAYKQEFISFMMRTGVLTFGDFTLKSGRRSPYFINTGKYRTGEQLTKLGQAYARCLHNTVGSNFDLLFGPAYKGIPLAALTCASLYREYGLDRAYFFNRKEVKDHGEGGSFVGAVPADGDRVVIVEDVITAGTAVRETVPLLRAAADVKIEHMIISVDRMERAQNGLSAVQEVKESFGITVHPIVTVREIIEHIRQLGDGKTASRMEAYLEQYCV